jgi:hypothetical protein
MNTNKSSKFYKKGNFTNTEWELLEKYAPCLAFDDNEPFFPVKIGCTIYYQSHHPPSLSYYYKKYWPWAQLVDFGRSILITSLYEKPLPDLTKYIKYRFQPVLMTIRDGPAAFHRAKRVLEYAMFYYADIQHVYELEHCWMYLDEKDELIGVKGTRHGVYMNMYSNPREIKYLNGHPILFVSPGKHELGPNVDSFSFRILKEACSKLAGSVGIYRFYFVPKDELRPVALLHMKKEYIREAFMKKYAFEPSFHWHKCRIPKRNILISWDELVHLVPKFLVSFLSKL